MVRRNYSLRKVQEQGGEYRDSRSAIQLYWMDVLDGEFEPGVRASFASPAVDVTAVALTAVSAGTAGTSVV